MCTLPDVREISTTEEEQQYLRTCNWELNLDPAIGPRVSEVVPVENSHSSFQAGSDAVGDLDLSGTSGGAQTAGNSVPGRLWCILGILLPGGFS